MLGKNCIRYYGRIYCYDESKDRAYVYVEKEVAFSEFPDSVLKYFVKNKDFTEVEIREEAVQP